MSDQGEMGTTGHQAWCQPCNWRGLLRWATADAEADLAEHMATSGRHHVGQVHHHAAEVRPPEGMAVRVEIDTADLARLDLRPGEILLLRVPNAWSAEDAHWLRNHVVGILDANGYENDVIPLPKDVALAALTPAAEPAEAEDVTNALALCLAMVFGHTLQSVEPQQAAPNTMALAEKLRTSLAAEGLRLVKGAAVCARCGCREDDAIHGTAFAQHDFTDTWPPDDAP